ncbi:MAG: heparin lyase I family protein [Thermoleophilia bacterium]|nr:heparin lyase I family protein [Thermoleophilia bacterium]
MWRAAAPALAACVLGAAVPGAAAAVLWSADAETGDLRQWRDGGGVVNSGSGSVTVTSGGAHSGRHAFRLAIRGADGTRPAQAARLFRWRIANGSPLPVDAWYSAAYRIPRAYRGMRWWNVMQWKTKISGARNDPAFVLNIGQGRRPGLMRLYLWDAIASRNRGTSPIDVPAGRWFHVQVRYRWSAGHTGSVTVVQDGRRVISVTGVRTAYPSLQREARQWSVNNYTDRIVPSAATVLLDDVAIAGPDAIPTPLPLSLAPGR